MCFKLKVHFKNYSTDAVDLSFNGLLKWIALSSVDDRNTIWKYLFQASVYYDCLPSKKSVMLFRATIKNRSAKELEYGATAKLCAFRTTAILGGPTTQEWMRFFHIIFVYLLNIGISNSCMVLINGLLCNVIYILTLLWYVLWCRYCSSGIYLHELKQQNWRESYTFHELSFC